MFPNAEFEKQTWQKRRKKTGKGVLLINYAFSPSTFFDSSEIRTGVSWPG